MSCMKQELGSRTKTGLSVGTQPIGVANDFANVVYERPPDYQEFGTPEKVKQLHFEWLKPGASRRGSRFGDRPSARL